MEKDPDDLSALTRARPANDGGEARVPPPARRWRTRVLLPAVICCKFLQIKRLRYHVVRRGTLYRKSEPNANVAGGCGLPAWRVRKSGIAPCVT